MLAGINMGCCCTELRKPEAALTRPYDVEKDYGMRALQDMNSSTKASGRVVSVHEAAKSV